MVRRDFTTPPSLPETNITRCVAIPASRHWLGLMNAALLFLSEAWRYEQIDAEDMTPEETAAVWYSIYEQYLTGECEGVGCCTELRRNPNTGRLEASTDGGLTWLDVDEGPWVDAPNVPYATTPPPLAQGSDEADRCLAAWNAADVIAEFYRQTAGEAGALSYNTLLSMNMFLNELNNALLELVYPQQGRLLNASGFLDFDWGEYAEAPTLDSTALDALRCLLFCNATVTDGIVSFDFGAVFDNLIAELGANPGTAVTLLVGYMGEAGLNHAGGVLANDTAECDCPACDGTWCYEFDFTATNGGFNPVAYALPAVGSNGVYSAGIGWEDTTVATGSARRRGVGIEREFTATVITRVEMEYSYTGGAGSGWSGSYATMGLNLGETTVIDRGYPTGPLSSPAAVDGEWPADSILFSLMSSVCSSCGSSGGTATITRLTLYGNGENPFGEDNCE